MSAEMDWKSPLGCARVCAAATMKRARRSDVGRKKSVPFLALDHAALGALFARVDCALALKLANRRCRAAHYAATRTTSAMIAASPARIEWARRALGCPFSDADYAKRAAAAGCIDVLSWLDLWRGFKFSKPSSGLCTAASANGHRDTVAWLHARNAWWSQSVQRKHHEEPAREGPFAVLDNDALELLFGFVECGAALALVNRACRDAAAASARKITPAQVVASVSMAAWMKRTLKCPFKVKTLVRHAVHGGDHQVLLWISHNYKRIGDVEGQLLAVPARAGNLKMLIVLLTLLNRVHYSLVEAGMKEVVQAVVDNKDTDMLMYLKSARSSLQRDPSSVWLVAVRTGRADVLRWLLKLKWPLTCEEFLESTVSETLYRVQWEELMDVALECWKAGKLESACWPVLDKIQRVIGAV